MTVYNSLLEDSDSEAVGVIFDTLATYQRFGRRTPHLHRRQAVDGGNTVSDCLLLYYHCITCMLIGVILPVVVC